MYQINAVYELVFDERDEFIILSIYMFLNFRKMKKTPEYHYAY